MRLPRKRPVRSSVRTETLLPSTSSLRYHLAATLVSTVLLACENNPMNGPMPICESNPYQQRTLPPHEPMPTLRNQPMNNRPDYSANTHRVLAALSGSVGNARAFNIDRLRKAWIDHWRREARRARNWVRFEMVGPPYCRSLPKRLDGLPCGAKLRDGSRCPCTDISKRNGRCPAHGGASTGPRTAAGKARCAANSGLPAMWAELRTQ